MKAISFEVFEVNDKENCRVCEKSFATGEKALKVTIPPAEKATASSSSGKSIYYICSKCAEELMKKLKSEA